MQRLTQWQEDRFATTSKRASIASASHFHPEEPLECLGIRLCLCLGAQNRFRQLTEDHVTTSSHVSSLARHGQDYRLHRRRLPLLQKSKRPPNVEKRQIWKHKPHRETGMAEPALLAYQRSRKGPSDLLQREAHWWIWCFAEIGRWR